MNGDAPAILAAVDHGDRLAEMQARLIERDMLRRGSTIGMISSAAGLGWEANMSTLRQLLETTDWDAAVQWMVDNNHADYFHTKQAVCAYVASQAYPMLKRGIRINAICPGPTDTPLAQKNPELWLGFGADYREETGTQASTPLDQAFPLVFLCSDAAVAINGQTLVSDLGYLAAGVTGVYPGATPIAEMLLGRSAG